MTSDQTRLSLKDRPLDKAWLKGWWFGVIFGASIVGGFWVFLP